MSDPVEIRRAGPLAPLELQLRRVETRTAALVHELEILLELEGRGFRMTHEQSEAIARQLAAVSDVVVRLAESPVGRKAE